MWVFTPFGFFSAVSHRTRPRYVLVRARVRADLEELVKRIPTLKAAAIQSTPEADYPFRVVVAKSQFATFLRFFVEEELDYPNFKATVPQRALPYHEVWAALHALEKPRA